MSTRLSILGVIRIFQPVSGYDIRRELSTWQLEPWTNFQPGSVYSSLRTLERDGMIVGVSPTDEGARPGRIDYAITPEGEKEFETLLRNAWWKVTQPVEPMIPAISLLPFMNRSELIAAVEARLPQLEGQIAQFGFALSSIRDGATGAGGDVPEHVREMYTFLTRRIEAEIAWLRGLAQRLRAGEYTLADEPGFPEFPVPPDARRPRRRRTDG